MKTFAHKAGRSVGILALVAFLTLSAFQAPAAAATQDNWRQCRRCTVMFYNGFPKKGRCPAGQAHVADSRNFILPHDVSETPTAQSGWRFCSKCFAMFFDGFANKGVCAAGGGHFAQGYMFVLPHDVPPRGVVQANWRYCEKCHAMFFEGAPNVGRCAAGGGHKATGYKFVLRYRGNLEGDVEQRPVND